MGKEFVLFQQVTYGGMPVVVEDVYARVLEERGEPFPEERGP